MAEPFTIARADTFWARAKGLLGVRHLDAGQALWLAPCRAVHTCGMRMAIDVVFLDAHDQILRVCAPLRPNRSAWCWRAHSVVELAAGFCQRHADYAEQIVRQCGVIRQSAGLEPCPSARQTR